VIEAESKHRVGAFCREGINSAGQVSRGLQAGLRTTSPSMASLRIAAFCGDGWGRSKISSPPQGCHSE